MLDHVAQRQFVNTVAEKRFFISAHHAVIVKLINPSFTQAERRGRQAKQANVRIHFAEVSEDLLILAVIVVADPMALIDNQQ